MGLRGPPSNPAIDDLIDKAVQDLSERLGIEPDEITLVEARRARVQGRLSGGEFRQQ